MLDYVHLEFGRSDSRLWTAGATDRRRAIADRNVQAILDAAEELLRNHAPVTLAAVATQSGVSQVTVYAHLATGEALLEAGQRLYRE